MIWCELEGNQEGGEGVGNNSVKCQLTPPEALGLGLTRGAEPWRRESGRLQYARAIK